MIAVVRRESLGEESTVDGGVWAGGEARSAIG
jgi:hypothetical protein